MKLYLFITYYNVKERKEGNEKGGQPLIVSEQNVEGGSKQKTNIIKAHCLNLKPKPRSDFLKCTI